MCGNVLVCDNCLNPFVLLGEAGTPRPGTPSSLRPGTPSSNRPSTPSSVNSGELPATRVLIFYKLI